MHWRFLSVRVSESNCTFILNLSFVSFSFSVCVACVLACFNFFFKEGEKNFEILLSGWLCKLFDKALVAALARGALAMCLQMRWHYSAFHLNSNWSGLSFKISLIFLPPIELMPSIIPTIVLATND